jgi:hypothetical protein
MTKQLQQGDVILTQIKSLPEGAIQRKPDTRGVVLAEGEVTGHFHGIKEKGVHLYEQNGEVFLVNESGEPVCLNHQEHNPVTVDPGVWKVGIVREFDYLQEMERKVVD